MPEISAKIAFEEMQNSMDKFFVHPIITTTKQSQPIPTTNLTVKFYSDPGHGWIAVKYKLLEELNITNKITSYSYRRGKTVYLEEDCDAYLFIKEMEKNGVKVVPAYKYTDKVSPIRSYESYYST